VRPVIALATSKRVRRHRRRMMTAMGGADPRWSATDLRIDEQRRSVVALVLIETA
jgi:hypothetical protein